MAFYNWWWRIYDLPSQMCFWAYIINVMLNIFSLHFVYDEENNRIELENCIFFSITNIHLRNLDAKVTYSELRSLRALTICQYSAWCSNLIRLYDCEIIMKSFRMWLFFALHFDDLQINVSVCVFVCVFVLFVALVWFWFWFLCVKAVFVAMKSSFSISYAIFSSICMHQESSNWTIELFLKTSDCKFSAIV